MTFPPTGPKWFVALALLLGSCVSPFGGGRAPAEVLWSKSLSTGGSTRGTGYAMSNKIITAVQATYPEHQIGQSGSMSIDASGRLYVALEAQESPGGWGHPSAEVVLLSSDDRGASFELLPISPGDPTKPCWLASLERPFGARPIAGTPSLVYTRGGPGEGVTGGEATEIIFVRLGPDR